MKVIDLLNKIANGEEVPKIIKYQNSYYKFYERLKDFYNYKKIDINTMEYLDSYLEDEYFLTNILTNEVEIIKGKEIIEEDKEIEELNLDADALKGDEIVRTIDYLLESKINSLVKAINELKKGK